MNDGNDRYRLAAETANRFHRSALRFFRVLREKRPAKGLSSSKLSVLGRLYRDGITTSTALAAYLRVQPQSLTRLLAGLEREGLITRRPNDADRRQGLLEITEAGAALLIKEIGDQRAMLAEAIENGLTTTERELLRLAAGLMDHLAETAEARPEDSSEPKQP